MRRKNVTPMERQSIESFLAVEPDVEKVAKQVGRSPGTVYKIRREVVSRKNTPEGAQPPRNFQLARQHQEDLMKPLIELRLTELLSVQDLDLAIFYSRPDEPSWPISNGRLLRTGDEALEVQLNCEATLKWTYLQQHLEGDSVWAAIEDLKTEMARDLASRLELLKAVIRVVESLPEDGGLRLAGNPGDGFCLPEGCRGARPGRQPLLCLPAV